MELHTATLHVLLDRIGQGDAPARDELLARIWQRVERLCRKMLRTFPRLRRLEDTGDVLHPALLKLLHSVKELRPASTRDFFGLACEQIRRTLLDLARSYNRARRRPGDGQLLVALAATADSAAGAPEPAAPDQAPDLERWQVFHEAVTQLPVDDREVFNLIFYNGLKQKEVTEVLGVVERTVRRRWASACLKLRDIMGSDMPDLA